MQTPSLRFRKRAWDKLVYFRDKGDTEVSMFGITNKDDPLLVEDVRLVEQVCTYSTTEMSQEGIADLIDKLTDEGIAVANISRIWCHTHPGESPNPSGTDEETFKREFGLLDWAVMFILAKKGEMYCRFKQNTWPALEMEIPVYTAPEKYDRTQDDADFERCVKKKQYGYASGNHWDNSKSVVVGGPSSTAPFHRRSIGTPSSTVTNGATQTATSVLGYNRQPTKREKRYIRLHGTIDGFVHPKNCHLEPLKLLDKPAEVVPVKLEKLETGRNLIPYMEQTEVYDLDLTDEEQDLILDPVALQEDVDDYEQSLGTILDEIVQVNRQLGQSIPWKEREELREYMYELQQEARDLRRDLFDTKRLLKAVQQNQATEQSDEEALKEAYAAYAQREGDGSVDEPTDLELFPAQQEDRSLGWDPTIDFVT